MFRGPAFWLAAAVLCTLARPALAHRVNVFAYVEGDTVHVECGYNRSDRVRFGRVEVKNPATGTVYLTGKTDDKGNFSFTVPPEARAGKADLRILLQAGEGHQNDWTIKADEYLAAAPAGALPTGPAPVAAFQAAVPAAPPATSPAPPGRPQSPETAMGSDAGQTPAAAPAVIPMPTAAPGDKPRSAPPAAASEGGQAVSPLSAVPVPVVATLDQAALQAVVEAAVEKKIAPLRKMLLDDKEKGPGMTEIFGGIGYLVGLAGLLAYAKSRKRGSGA